ncbi:MAG: DUF1588 domain-containing protein [Halieaceae bacterium]|nr:DUF1588 domain-containing protein [Halieaceae bacterium]
MNKLAYKHRTLFLSLMLCTLAGCFQAQLNGPVEGAQITVSKLNDSSVVYVQSNTSTQESVIAIRGWQAWNDFTNLIKLLLLGVATDKLVEPEADQLFLVTAFSGTDKDWDMDGVPNQNGIAVSGEWHALVPGSNINDPTIKVSALTEALYLWIAPALGALSNAEVMDNLNSIAGELVGDVDDNGIIDYVDVLKWSRILNDDFHAGLPTLNNIAYSIRTNGDLTQRSALSQALIGLPAPTPPSAEEHFADNLADAVLSASCLECHVEGGVADLGGARLIFESEAGPGQNAANSAAFEDFLSSVENAEALILSKIRGVGHGGGNVFSSFTDQYRDIEIFLDLLAGGSGTGSSGSLSQFWYGVSQAGATKTLRRAATIFAGRSPTEAEYEMARSGNLGLRDALMGLLDGPGFHEFLIRGANDRLHTDGFLYNLPIQVSNVDSAGFYPVGANKFYLPNPPTEDQQDARFFWENQWRFGVIRAPLELIAHVVENNLPYTETLTANYTMVNWQMSEIMRSGVDFGSAQDPLIFKPGQNRGQIIQDDNYSDVYSQEGGLQVISHSGFIDYPHAGILNTLAWLNRYPTTETNRNRARSRWTYRHFLGVDIERTAQRTTDPEALADTDNPTLNNPACTVCHIIMDPVAGAYQNYGNDGIWRDSWGGMDSLPDTYKYPEWFDESAVPSPYQEGDTWFRGVLKPGFGDAVAPSSDNSLQWLAQKIAQDPRFATAVVAFWWPAIIGEAVMLAPQSTTNPDYDQLLRKFDAQQASIAALAADFAQGNYQLRELLVEIALSPWFRSERVDPSIVETRSVELAGLGTSRLLTAEELEAKTHAILGQRWGEWTEPRGYWNLYTGVYTGLANRFRLYYGGIDSVGIKQRSRQMNALMANVTERQALESSCAAVVLDFLLPQNNRRFFSEVDRYTTPLSEARKSFNTSGPDYASRTVRTMNMTATGGRKKLRINFENDGWDEATQQDRNLYIDSVVILRGGNRIAKIEGEDFPEQEGFAQATGVDEQGNTWETGDIRHEPVDDECQEVGWAVYGTGWVEFDIVLPQSGQYVIKTKAWGSRLADNVPARMGVAVNGIDTAAGTAGSEMIKRQIQLLYHQMLGDELPTNHAEIEAVYQLLLERWQERRLEANNTGAWTWPEEDCSFPRELSELEWQNVGNDPEQMINSWNSVMYYFLTHFDYLHE